MNKTVFHLLFITIVIYSILGLQPLARLGGPCDGGLVIIFFAPAIIIISLIHLIIFRRFIMPGKTINVAIKIISILCTIFWGFWTFAFMVDAPKLTSIYMIPFFILSFSLTLITSIPNLSNKFKLKTE